MVDEVRGNTGKSYEKIIFKNYKYIDLRFLELPCILKV